MNREVLEGDVIAMVIMIQIKISTGSKKKKKSKVASLGLKTAKFKLLRDLNSDVL